MRNPAGERLAVRVADARSSPLVLLVHGFTASKDANFFPSLFDRLATGWSVVSMDLSAHGESEGSFAEMDFDKLEADLDTVLDAYDGREVVIIGHSMGGSLAYRIAARRSNVSGLVLLAPGFGIRSSFLRGLRARAIENGSASFTDGFGVSRTVSGSFFTSREYDPIELAPHVTVPTLILCGELDYTISNEACARLAQRLADARFETIEGVGHTFADSDELIGPMIVSFLERRFAADEA